jgi:hypothetical protein
MLISKSFQIGLLFESADASALCLFKPTSPLALILSYVKSNYFKKQHFMAITI